MKHLCCADIGNEEGEPLIAERKIRIMDKPLFATSGIHLLNSYVGRHPFSALASDHDAGRRARLEGRTQVQ